MVLTVPEWEDRHGRGCASDVNFAILNYRDLGFHHPPAEIAAKALAQSTHMFYAIFMALPINACIDKSYSNAYLIFFVDDMLPNSTVIKYLSRGTAGVNACQPTQECIKERKDSVSYTDSIPNLYWCQTSVPRILKSVEQACKIPL